MSGVLPGYMKNSLVVRPCKNHVKYPEDKCYFGHEAIYTSILLFITTLICVFSKVSVLSQS